ncbi:hypothetical protein GCM10028809_22720 [Spirosoma gilvum]
MTGKTVIPVSADLSKVLGLCWLLACIGLVAAAIGYWLQTNWWIGLALGSVVLSQALIIVYWPDAKAGTIANLVILVVLGFAYANLRFERQANQDAQQLLKQAESDSTLITTDMLADLPTPVKQWLEKAGIVGKEKIHTVRLRQEGLMRTRPDGKWMPAEAEQYFTVDQPGFVWKAESD